MIVWMKMMITMMIWMLRIGNELLLPWIAEKVHIINNAIKLLLLQDFFVQIFISILQYSYY